jgi:hypothetical protein
MMTCVLMATELLNCIYLGAFQKIDILFSC